MNFLYLFLEYVALIGGGGLTLVLGLVAYRRWEQRKVDQDRMTYRLTFPSNLDLDTAALLFSNLSGTLKRKVKVAGVQVPNLMGDPTIVVEIFSTTHTIAHLLSFPRSYEPSIQDSLMGTIPNVGFEEVQPDYAEWTYAVELDAGRANFEPDHRHTGALLSSFGRLQSGQAILAQFILSPMHYTDIDGEAPVFRVVGRLASRGHEIPAKGLLQRVGYQYSNLKVFTTRQLPQSSLHLVRERLTSSRWPVQLTAKALAIACGMVLDGAQVHGMDISRGRHLPAASSIPSSGIQLGAATYSGAQRPVATTIESLMTHEWVVGSTGSGKSTLLENQAAQIMAAGKGLILIEPDGRLAKAVLASVPLNRVDHVIWFDPNDEERPIGFNLLAGPDPERTAGYIVSLFKGLYSDSWGPRLEQILSYSVLTAALNGMTIYDVKQLLINPDFRAQTVKQTDNSEVKHFWRRLDDGPDNAVDSVLNKIDALVRSSKLRNIVGQAEGLDIAEVIREGKILIVPLSEEHLGRSNASLLGATLIARIWSEMRLRGEGVEIIVMLDEFQHYMEHAPSLLAMFDEMRKYRGGLIVANQRLDQLGTSMLSAVSANALTKVAYRSSPGDAKSIQRHFEPLTAGDIAGLQQYHAAMSLMTSDGVAPTVTVKTNPPPKPTGSGWLAKERSRLTYGVPIAEVEAAMQARHKVAEKPERPKFGRRAE